jgi:hypothetical protein
MIRGSPCRLRIDPAEIECTEIKLLDKHVNYANRVVLVDPIIQAFGKQRRLPAIYPLDEALHRDLPPKIASELYHAGRFHTAWVELSRSAAVIRMATLGRLGCYARGRAIRICHGRSLDHGERHPLLEGFPFLALRTA